ncbi:VrrA/YqfQ family protein [Bacillus sp. Marseille-Q1617]|uniref:VrrA/YqfQ family protein n=1 Tax=Bacillus sp. Marseille-Q1617 TaxID=2736887 RepID=UPI00158CCFCC|nr:VrrA/YqfQ family protein [Bacillus sp. Marseille-Q1617]
MPPRGRMRMQNQQQGNPFGMMPRQGGRSPFGLRQPGEMRNPFGMRSPSAPPFQIGQQMNGFMGEQGPAPMNMQGMPGGRRKGRGGGLLAKLLKKGDRGNQQGGILEQFSRGDSRGAAPGFERGPGAAAGASTIGNLLNPGNISSFLSNTQQVLNAAQQFGPMIQQYGPMVKNLPALWKLYRGFKDLSADESPSGDAKNEEDELEADLEETDVKEPKKKRKVKKEVAIEEEAEVRRPKKKSPAGSSKPKLYI